MPAKRNFLQSEIDLSDWANLGANSRDDHGRYGTEPQSLPAWFDPYQAPGASSTPRDDSNKAPGKSTDIPMQEPHEEVPKKIASFASFDHETQLLQQWEGTVTRISKNGFSATLRDFGRKEYAEEQATFEFDAIPKEDLPLIVVGAVFYWSVGYRTERSGQKFLLSAFRFRRLPAWSMKDIERARQEASRFESLFDG